jgi:hypothetical protein
VTEEPDLEPAFVHVVRGEPDDVELAALVAGLAAAVGSEAEELAAPAHSAWTDRARAMRTRIGPRTPIAAGPGAWRWSLRG